MDLLWKQFGATLRVWQEPGKTGISENDQFKLNGRVGYDDLKDI